MTVLGLGASKTYYVRVRSYTVKGGKTYYGNWSDAKSIVTAKTNFANAKVSGISSKSFTGKAITQKITVKYGSKTLKNGTDYTVKYSANTKVGTAKVTITGKGIYGGVITKSFAIYPAKQVIQKLYGTYAGFFIDYAQKGSATGYEISYSQRSDFKGAKSVKVTNNRTDKKTVSGLARYQKYYVRVRSYTVKDGKTYNGAWSDKNGSTLNDMTDDKNAPDHFLVRGIFCSEKFCFVLDRILLRYLTDNSAWISCRKRIWRYVTGDNASCTDNTALAYGNPACDDNIARYPAVGVYCDRFAVFIIINSAVRLFLHVTLLPSEWVNRCGNGAVGTEKHVVANGHRAGVKHCQIEVCIAA